MAEANTPEREYPKVWSAFERVLKDGRSAKFEVQDIPEDMMDTVAEFMMNNYIREEVWCVAAGTAKDPVAIQEYRVLLASIVREKMSTACFLITEDGAGRTLVGASIAFLQKRDSIVDHRPPSSKAGLKTLRMFIEAMKITVLFEKYHVTEYLMGAGISVVPEYRGFGIAVAMLQARKEIAQSLGIKVTGGIFTGSASQRSAELAGLEVCYQVPYKDFGKQCGITFHTSTQHMKIYALDVSDSV